MSAIENQFISLLRRQEVQARTGLARSTIYKLISEGAFPQPISLVGKTVAWPSPVIDRWIAERIAASKTN